MPDNINAARKPPAEQLQQDLLVALPKARSLKNFVAKLYSLALLGNNKYLAVIRLTPRGKKDAPFNPAELNTIARELSRLVKAPMKFRQFVLGKTLRLAFIIKTS